MIALTALTVLCAGGVGFYLRFLSALCKECSRGWIGYLVRLSPETAEYALTEADDVAESMPRAA